MIPIDPFSGKYDQFRFDPRTAGGRLSQQEFDSVMDKIHNMPIVQEKLDRKVPEKCAFVWITAFGFGGFVLMAVIGFLSSDFGVFPIVMGVWFVSTAILMFTCPCHQVKLRNKRMIRRKAILDTHFEALNTEFRARQIRWKAGEYGGWIELCLDYVGNN